MKHPLILVTLRLMAPLAALAGEAERDFTFFALSDVHVGAENLKATPPVTRAQTLAKANLKLMRGVAGQPFPKRTAFAGLALGAVAAPRGVFVLGDLTDGSRDLALEQEQWRTFDALYPAGGVLFGGAVAPVFAIVGNHDDAVGSAQRLGVAARNRALLQAGQLAALSPNGLHVAANWDAAQRFDVPLRAGVAQRVAGAMEPHSYLLGKVEEKGARLWQQLNGEYPERPQELRLVCPRKPQWQIEPAAAALEQAWDEAARTLRLCLSFTCGAVEVTVQ